MEWRGRRGSRNVEDRRANGGGGGGGGLPGMRNGRGAATGMGGAGAIVVVLLAMFFGFDPAMLLQSGGAPQSYSSEPRELTAQDKEEGEFVSVILASTEEIWANIFKTQLNRTYNPATLVLFKDGTSSPCGGASQATGPFYCPGDQKVYLDTSFFLTMHKQLGAEGDFAAAYVVAHEIGHHVQNELGILTESNRVRQRVNEAESNQISVMIELQADCLSGIWARNADLSVDQSDIKEAVNAARQIGDDTLQRNAGQRPMPHTFTHGTSEQRSRWFLLGFTSGQLADCDTFSARRL